MSNKEKFIDINLNFYPEKYKEISKEHRFCRKDEDSKIYYFKDIVNIKEECKKKCNSLKDNCNAFMYGRKQNPNSDDDFNICKTFKVCHLNSENMKYNKRFKFYAKLYQESFSLHIIFLIILIIQMILMIGFGLSAISRKLRKNL